MIIQVKAKVYIDNWWDDKLMVQLTFKLPWKTLREQYVTTLVSRNTDESLLDFYSRCMSILIGGEYIMERIKESVRNYVNAEKKELGTTLTVQATDIMRKELKTLMRNYKNIIVEVKCD